MRYSKIQYVCWLFSGAEISLLKECPTDFNRQASIGFTIFMTCLLAGLSGGFAAWRFTADQQTHEGNWVAALIFGLVWGLLVFSIDRSMVVTLKKDPTQEKQPFLVPLVTRMILAGLLAFMISIPLETKIFEPEIEKQALDDIQNDIQRYGTSVAGTSGIGGAEERKKAAAEQARIASQQFGLEDNKVPGVPGLLADAAAQDAIERTKNGEAQRQSLKVEQARARCYVEPRMDSETGLMKPGYYYYKGSAGTLFNQTSAELKRLKKAAKDARESAAQLRLEAGKKADAFREKADKSGSQASDAAAKAEVERIKIQAKNDSLKAIYDKQLQKRGFVSQFVSMEHAAKGNGAMLFFLWFIRILFFVIEILPTIVKLATPVGEYDHQLYSHERMFALALKTNYQILEEREVVRQQTELKITTQLEQTRQEKEVELGQKLLEQTATIQNSLAKQILSKWEKAEREKLKPVTPIVVAPTSAPPIASTSFNQPSAYTQAPQPTVQTTLVDVTLPVDVTQNTEAGNTTNQVPIAAQPAPSVSNALPIEDANIKAYSA